MRRADWTHGNAARLLENGEEFFPRVFHAIAQATEVVLVETFILCEDKVGIALAEALCASARGATTVLTIDGFGSPDLSDAFIARLTDAGVRVRIFDPGPAVLGQQLNLLRRMHRKLLVVDNRVAFVGGIGFFGRPLDGFRANGQAGLWWNCPAPSWPDPQIHGEDRWLRGARYFRGRL